MFRTFWIVERMNHNQSAVRQPTRRRCLADGHLGSPSILLVCQTKRRRPDSTIQRRERDEDVKPKAQHQFPFHILSFWIAILGPKTSTASVFVELDVQYLIVVNGYAGVPSLVVLVAIVLSEVVHLTFFVNAHLVYLTNSDTRTMET